MGAAIPINNAMAPSLDEGSVSTLGIGIKLVIFISGLVGTTITTVMIPYFSGLMAKRKHMEARRELSYFLVLATFVSVPLTLLLFSTSSQIVDLFFQGGVLQSADVEGIARVFKYGILQIPFFTCGMLFMRFDIAQKRSGIVLISTALALVVIYRGFSQRDLPPGKHRAAGQPDCRSSGTVEFISSFSAPEI